MSEKKPLKIATASDQAIFLRGLSSLVMAQPGASLVGEGRCGKEILQLCDLTAPDLVLLDARECGEAALDTIRQIHSRLPAARILLLLSQGEDCPFQDELDALPVYFISREVSEEEFAAALQQARKDIETPEAPPAPAAPAAFPPASEEEEAQPVIRKATRRTLPLRSEELLTRELTMAGRIQTDILPEANPVIPGWDLAMRLEPARETSGDFYDVIPLSGHKCGVVIADVTDKGMGAALFMVLSNTLIRTYAARFPTLPAVVLSAVSERLLSDTRSGMFVTTFFGILETNTGRFIYANAGHPPGFLVSSQRGKISIDRLQPTGMALGVSEQARWKQKFVKLAPGDYLILYTDGITEAQNPEGEFFGEDMLLDVVLSRVGSPAKVVQDALLHEVHQFVGNTPRQDDIALIVIRREDYLTSSKYFRAV